MFYVKVNQEDLKQNNDIALYGKQQKCEEVVNGFRRKKAMKAYQENPF